MIDTQDGHQEAAADGPIVPVPSHPAYWVQPSTQTVFRRGPSGSLRPMKASKDGKGYMAVHLYRDGRPTLATIHRLVYEAVHGPIPDGMMVLHRNDDKLDNAPANLYAGTGRDNAADARRNGRLNPARGERHWAAKLDPDRVRLVHRFDALGFRQRAIADLLGVSRQAVSDVLRGDTWSHVDRCNPDRP